MGVAPILLIYGKAKFPKFLESENFQNFVRIILLWTFIINISRYFEKFTKIWKFFKILTETRFALDCEIFKNFKIFWDFSKKKYFKNHSSDLFAKNA